MYCEHYEKEEEPRRHKVLRACSENKAGVPYGEVLGPIQAPKNQPDTFCSVMDLSVTQVYSFSI